MVYGDFKVLTRTVSHKILHDKAFNIAKHPNFEDVIQELSEELHRSIIRKFEKRKIHSPFVQNIWGANLRICN